jgi:hypothetical protein
MYAKVVLCGIVACGSCPRYGQKRPDRKCSEGKKAVEGVTLHLRMSPPRAKGHAKNTMPYKGKKSPVLSALSIQQNRTIILYNLTLLN